MESHGLASDKIKYADLSGRNNSMRTVVTYIVAGLLLFLSSTEQFFEPVLYYEISR